MKYQIQVGLITFCLGVVIFPNWVWSQCGPIISTFPYTENFEASAGWTTGGANSDWTWGTPAHPTINTAGGGLKSWCVGGLTGSAYQNSQQSWIMSPCFDFTTLDYPWISFKIFWECERRWDGAVLQYTLNGGTTWSNVGAFGDPTDCLNQNWFNYNNITWLNSVPAGSRHGWSGRIGPTVGNCTGTMGSTTWVTSTHCMANLANQPSVRFRFLFGSGSTCNSFDGIAIDDVYIGRAPVSTPTFTYNCTSSTTVDFTNTSVPCLTTYAWNFGDPVSGANNTSQLTTPTHTFSGPGTYQVKLKSTGTCSSPDSLVIPITILDITGAGTNVLCYGGSDGTASVTVDNAPGPFTYAWNPGGNTTAVINNLPAGTYSVNVSGTGYCRASTSVVLTEPAVFSAAEVHTGNICPAECNGASTITPNGGISPYAYSWYPGVGNTDQVNGLCNGTYTCIVTDANGCNASSTVIIQASGGGLQATTTTTPVACSGSNDGSASVSILQGNPPYQYQWNTQPVQTTQTITGLSVGTYQVNITDNIGCIVSDTATVLLSPSTIQINTTYTPTTCLGSSDGSATALGLQGHPPYTYQWNIQPVQTSTTVTGLSVGSYSILVTDVLGCVALDTVNVTTLEVALQVSNTISAPACYGSSDGAIEVTPLNGNAPYQYQWNTQPVQTTQNINGIASGTYTVQISDASGCNTTQSYILTGPSAIQINLGITPITCKGGQNGRITATGLGGIPGYQYVWSTQPAQSTATATGLGAGTYRVTVTDARQCSISKDTFLSDPASLQVNTFSNPATCSLGVDGSASILPVGGTSPYTIVWQTNPPQMGSQLTNVGAGMYHFSITDGMNCLLLDSILVDSVNPLTVTKQVNQPSCYGVKDGSILISPSNGQTPYTYSWNTTSVSSTGGSELEAGQYSYVILDHLGCRAEETIDIVYPLPVPKPWIFSDTICPGELGIVQAMPQSGLITHWFNTQQNKELGVGTSYSAGTLYSTQIFFAVNEDSVGCRSIPPVPAVIVVNPFPNTKIQVNKYSAFLPGALIEFSAEGEVSNGNDQWIWDFGDLQTSTSKDITHEYLLPGQYQVNLTQIDINGCKNTDRVLINIERFVNIVIPNAFTPNGDGFNDLFGIRQVAIATMDFQIFDRWGNLIFRTQDPQFTWDGTCNGQPVPEGVYIYLLKGMSIFDTEINNTGDISVIR